MSLMQDVSNWLGEYLRPPALSLSSLRTTGGVRWQHLTIFGSDLEPPQGHLKVGQVRLLITLSSAQLTSPGLDVFLEQHSYQDLEQSARISLDFIDQLLTSL
jgi:hypothetical protein